MELELKLGLGLGLGLGMSVFDFGWDAADFSSLQEVSSMQQVPERKTMGRAWRTRLAAVMREDKVPVPGPQGEIRALNPGNFQKI
jgi:hypothetical protein